MYVTSSTEYQNHPVIVQVVMDVVGGGVIARADLVNTDELKAGTIVGKDANGLYHIFKTAKAFEAVGATDTTMKVVPGHDFKVGDFITDAALAKKAYAITAIAHTDPTYDTITIGTAIGAIVIGGILVQANAESATTGVYKITPAGVTMTAIDLTVANQASGILQAGKVDESMMPQYISSTIKALLPLIIFV